MENYGRSIEIKKQQLAALDLSVSLGPLHLKNPVLVASGTFGYAREMAGIVDFAKLGGIVPKTVTRQPRAGNLPPRTCDECSMG